MTPNLFPPSSLFPPATLPAQPEHRPLGEGPNLAPGAVIKCISLWEPWATLVAIGAKARETRPNRWSHRGWLLIQAAKHWSRDLDSICSSEPFRGVLRAAGIRPETRGRWGEAFPRGSIVALCRVTGADRTEVARTGITEQEWAFGDYSPGRWSMPLTDVRRFATPIPFKGSQGFFNVPAELVAAQIGGGR